MISYNSPSSLGYALPTFILTFSAVDSPIIMLYFVWTKSCILLSNSSPATGIDLLITIPPIEITATSVVPPPISTTMFPLASVTSIPEPIAAASGSSIKYVL